MYFRSSSAASPALPRAPLHFYDAHPCPESRARAFPATSIGPLQGNFYAPKYYLTCGMHASVVDAKDLCAQESPLAILNL